MCGWIWTFCTFYHLTFSKSDSWQACTHLFFCYLKWHVFHHILFLAFLVPYVFAVHYSSILVLLQSIYFPPLLALSYFFRTPLHLLVLASLLSALLPTMHHECQLWNPADTPGSLVSLTALIVTSSQKSAWHRLSGWQELSANVGASLSRGIYIQILHIATPPCP